MTNESEVPEKEIESQLEQSTYQIIRNRIGNHASDLKSRLTQLNDARRGVFGSIETKLLATERISTTNNCVPRDIVAVGKRFLFGYNVQLGLRSETNIEDVFGVYSLRDGLFHVESLELLSDSAFVADFKQVYKYYKQTTFAKFFSTGVHLYLVFQVGKSVADIKAFKWLIDGEQLRYLDARSDHEVRLPPQHDFDWKRTHRDLHRHGLHPHISIEDRVFVETVGGDLTIKVEDNTERGEGIYAEPVDDPDQTLDDADVFYATVGDLILLKMRPYQESAYRYLVYSEKVKQVRRLDTIENACVLLPEGHGLIFSNGYVLQTGEYKTFEANSQGLQFARRIASPNGEDYLYVFYNADSGTYVLLSYNVIEQRVATPIVCHGFSKFDDGQLIYFKAGDEPQKHHALQIWQTPYVGDEFTPAADTKSLLYKIGNQDIVRGMAECHEVLGLAQREDSYENLYLDLVKKCGDVLDAYHWLANDETFHLEIPLKEVKAAGIAAVDEFEKVVRVRANTRQQYESAAAQANQTIRAIGSRRHETINDFVQSLGELRTVRGTLVALRELRYIDLDDVNALEQDVVTNTERQSYHCVEFLLQDDSLTPYANAVASRRAQVEDLIKVSDAKVLESEIGDCSAELEMLIDVVSNLKIDDATQRTDIIDGISTIYSQVNQARATLKKKTRELMSQEGKAEFASQLKLLNQSVANYLDVCDAPEKCDEYLTKLMIQVEELEGRFAEFDDFVLELSDKREEVYSAFDGKKVALVESRNNRATTLHNAATRILKGIETRVAQFESVHEIHAYFAADLMVEKVRDIVEQLRQLEHSVKVDDVQSRLKTIREDAIRQLKDRLDLFVDGENVIRFGRHRFSVNVQELDLTTVIKDDRMHFHLTGTNFLEEINDPAFLSTVDLWSQNFLSENADVYRAEYLAYQIFSQISASDGETEVGSSTVHTLESARLWNEMQLLEYVRKVMAGRHMEGYVKGIHDHDAVKFLRALIQLDGSIGQLRYASRVRAWAEFAWHWPANESLVELKNQLQPQLLEFAEISTVFPDVQGRSQFRAELQALVHGAVPLFQQHDVRQSAGETGTPEPMDADADGIEEATDYLLELTTTASRFPIAERTATLVNEFEEHLLRCDAQHKFDATVNRLRKATPAVRLKTLRNWVDAFVGEQASETDQQYVDELSVVLLIRSETTGDNAEIDRPILRGNDCVNIEGFVGEHSNVAQDSEHLDARYSLRYGPFLGRLSHFERNEVPRYREYIELKKSLLDQKRQEMRLSEFKPRVLSSFVRNRLIDEVYLPLVGDNLAKQMGVVGEHKRTDLMGLLLLISPPGYGKTTLMEYVANRLGLTFMKINGPAIGHQVTSLDPTEAPHASAREEIQKLNLSLEMGDNVMIYVDDIQHCNPEFLQKFISLCDGQRKIEGVYGGQTRTYDLRGRKVAVVMSGNPYTESGDKFQIPDMLANRADTYNLGDVIGESQSAFHSSYLENALTSNPTLSPLASRSQADIQSLIRLAENTKNQRDVGEAELEGNYSAEELSEFVTVIRKLLRVRDAVLKVNEQYIASAGQADDYRTEPAFKLQGSYRDMNKIAERVVPIMNDDELQVTIWSHYENQAQTLTAGAEANLLKLKELLRTLKGEDADRWEGIKKTFARNLLLGGAGSDRLSQVIAQMSEFTDGLAGIKDVLTTGFAKANGPDESVRPGTDSEAFEQAVGHLSRFNDSLSEIGEALKGMGVASGNGGGAAQQVQVVYKVPRVFLDVIKAQFMIMERWLEPVMQLTQQQGADTDALAKSVDTAFKRYETLIKRMELASDE